MADQNTVVQLLRDYAVWRAAFGGAFPFDESAGVTEANYGPAGVIFTGAAFDKDDRARLEYSYKRLNAALRLLRRESVALWGSLVEPYLSDTADPGVVDHWKKELAKLDRENAQIRKHNKLVRKGKKQGSLRIEKVALVFTRMQLERHDKAIARLTEMLKHVDLHYVPPKFMSPEESQAIEDQNAEIYAVFQRFRARGNSVEDAAIQTAEFLSNAKDTRLSVDAVYRVLEFRDETRPESCAEPECDDPVYQQGRCVKHYWRDYRKRKKVAK